MLPVLHYPLLLPLLIGAMQISTALLKGEGGDIGLELRLVIVFDAIFTSLALYLIEFILVG
jgi:ABC-type transport system involved in cytochrome c biogenesis permease component